MSLLRRPRRPLRFEHATKKRAPVRLLPKHLPLPPATEIRRLESVFRMFALSFKRGHIFCSGENLGGSRAMLWRPPNPPPNRLAVGNCAPVGLLRRFLLPPFSDQGDLDHVDANSALHTQKHAQTRGRLQGCRYCACTEIAPEAETFVTNNAPESSRAL